MPEVHEYLSPEGKAPFSRWFESLDDPMVRARIRARLNRIRLDNFGDCKPLGGGLFELRLAFGPGFRVYFGRTDAGMVLLLGGGDKGTQARDITKARAAWNEYRRGSYG